MIVKYSRRLCLTAICLALAGCSSSQPKEELEAAVKKEAENAKKEVESLRGAVMKGAELRGLDSKGRPFWSLGAKEIKTSGLAGKDMLAGGVPNEAVLTDARATLYREGKPDTTLKAPRIDLYKTAKGVRLHLSGGIVATSAGFWTGKRGPVIVKSPVADVDMDSRVINASGGVKMNQGAIHVQSSTLRAETSLSQAKLIGNVVADGEQGQIKAISADWDWQGNKVVAIQPIATKDDIKITGSRLTADTAGKAGEITGQVVAKSAKGTARAPRVLFNWAKDRIEAATATLEGPDGTLKAGTLVTDSKLQVSQAKDLVVVRDGATIRAKSASGFDKLNRLQGQGVSYEKDGTTVTANDVAWGEGRVQAQGGVTLTKADLKLRADRVQGDDGFNNATATGGVRGQLPNGGTIAAPSARKIGDRIVASHATATMPTQGQLGKLTLKGDEVETDIKGENATVRGNVQVTSQTGAVLKAPQATYSKSTGKITAKGGVYFRDPRGLEQRGDTLVADVNLKQATLTNVKGTASGNLFEGKSLFR